MKIIFVTLLLATQTALAGEIGDKTDALSAQLRVTSDSLQQVLAKMRNAPGIQEIYAHPDFVAAANRFNALAEAAMIRFESTLKNDILSQIPEVLNRLESIKASPAYNADQRSALLVQQYKIAQNLMLDLEKKYRHAIYQLYTLDLPQIELDFVLKCPYFENYGDLYAKVTFADKSVDSPIMFPRDRKYCGSSGKSGSTSAAFPYEYFFSDIKNIIFSKSIKENCATQSCVSLFAIHRTAYLKEIQKEINKDLTFMTAAGRSLSLDAIRDNLAESIGQYFTSNVYDVENLPFAITPEKFQELQRTKGKD